ncbi:general stress protein [Phocicoccus pinnipedialis]|uniref:Uncharacterized protein n=1 Tax=Phocicoccus pinnipedialis TaxID=110845 RepID=A0A6V7R5Z4_9BACL|nr:general stress protein [Jeotgalicoccus pinnipedialis]MBP1939680.1 hypothetical protein [Jeotgalicoccus pinnipedialis]CAD2072302.1 hypothetical protein JEOPIN946_00400 [Jeotgalicoccus pinnipedialis]
MRKIESYLGPDEVLARITELRESGVLEEAITIITKPDIYEATFEAYGLDSMVVKSSTWEKFKSLFSPQDSESLAMSKLDLTDEEQDLYSRKLAEDEILLYVNDYESHDGHPHHVPKATSGSNFTTENIFEDNE